jgi:hypothetical protein
MQKSGQSGKLKVVVDTNIEILTARDFLSKFYDLNRK